MEQAQLIVKEMMVLVGEVAGQFGQEYVFFPSAPDLPLAYSSALSLSEFQYAIYAFGLVVYENIFIAFCWADFFILCTLSILNIHYPIICMSI